MKRIGREPRPIENGYRLMVENPTLLDELAFNVWESFMRPRMSQARTEWQALTEEQREMWRVEVVDCTVEEMNEPPEPDGGPGGGGGMPLGEKLPESDIALMIRAA